MIHCAAMRNCSLKAYAEALELCIETFDHLESWDMSLTDMASLVDSAITFCEEQFSKGVSSEAPFLLHISSTHTHSPKKTKFCFKKQKINKKISYKK